jgi:peptidoglycan hydrolase-like protein with peptidoglycan-binding domain
MNKTQYQKEIVIQQVMKKGRPLPQNKNVQEWLMLYKITHPTFNHTLSIDGDFGDKTEAAVKDFQSTNGLAIDGVVGQLTYQRLVDNMRKAFSKVDGANVRDLIVAYASQHLNNFPHEIGGANSGPWVRAYMDGLQGEQWPWCMGFAQTVLDQAFFSIGQDFKTVIPSSYSCDVVANKGKTNGHFVRNADAVANPGIIQHGDIFLLRNKKDDHDWTHTGIIIAVNQTKITTIEGNTNEQGAREGVKVGQLQRDLTAGNIDVYRTVL